MTLTTTTNVAVHEGNDVATEFAFAFRVISETHLVVTRRVRDTGLVDKTYVIDTEYSVTGVGTNAGTVTLVDPLAVEYDIIITRTVPYTQELDIVNQGGFFPEVVEQQFDLQAMQTQQVAGKVDRAVLAADGEDGLVVPAASSLIGVTKVVGTDPNTGALALLDSADFRGDPGGNVMATGLWSQFAIQTIPAGTDIVATSGYSATGVGNGFYVSDALADAVLAAAHPRFCKAEAGGRYFRLYSPNGILVEQGGAVGDVEIDYLVNNQPAIQACVNYGIAVGTLTILFQSPHYTIWTPARTYATNDYDLDQSGIPIVIDGAHVTLKSLCGRTDLWRRASAGGDPATWANWPLTSGGDYWRGGCIYLVGPLGSPPALFNDRSGVTLEDMHLQGGTVRGSGYGAMNLSTGDGWDLTDKAINAGGGDAYVGDIRLIRSSLIGYRGEELYGSGKTDCTIYVRDSYIAETNGSGINPNSCKLDVKGLLIRHCNLGVEGWSGEIGTFHAVIEDCIQAGTIGGGKAGVGTFSPYNLPTRINTYIPSLDIDIEVRKSGNLNLGAFLHGRGVTVVDCRVVFNGSAYADGIWDTHISEIRIITDELDTAGVDISGGDGATSATQGIQDVKIDKVSYSRTKAARTAARLPGTPFTWTKSLGIGIVVGKIEGEMTSPPVYTGTVTDYSPAFLDMNLSNISGFGNASQNVQTTPALSWRGPYVGISTTGTSVYTMTLPITNRNKGERLTLHGLGPGTARINGDPTSGSGLRSNSQSVFILPNMRTVFEWDGSYWFVVGTAVTTLTFSQTGYDAASLANGATDILTFTVTGIAVGDKVLNFSIGVSAAGLILGAPYVSAADTVSVPRYNPTGGAVDWASTTVRIDWTKAT